MKYKEDIDIEKEIAIYLLNYGIVQRISFLFYNPIIYHCDIISLGCEEYGSCWLYFFVI